jgi:hypothetical protein
MNRPLVIVLAILALITTLWGPSVYFEGVSNALTTNFAFDWAEGIVWAQLEAFRTGSAYSPLVDSPHLVFHYTPGFFGTTLATMSFIENGLQAGRMVAVASTLGTALNLFLLAYLGFPKGRQPWRLFGALVAALMFVSMPHVHGWGTFMRVDATAAWMTSLGMLLFILGRDRRWLTIAAFVLFVGAIYCKQNYIAAPAAALILLYREDHRRGVLAGLVFAGVGLAVLAGVVAVWGSEFLAHVFVYNMNEFNFGDLSGVVTFFPVVLFPVLLTAIAWLLEYRSNRSIFAYDESEASAFHFLVLSALAGGVLLIQVAKLGSDANYFWEISLPLCVGAGHAIGRVIEVSLTGCVQRKAAGEVALCLLIAQMIFYGTIKTNISSQGQWDLLKRSGIMAVAEIIRHPGPVMSDDPAILINAGKQVPYEPFILGDLIKQGEFDRSLIEDRYRRQEFGLLVFRMRSSLAPFDNVIASCYERGADLGIYAQFLPRSEGCTDFRNSD